MCQFPENQDCSLLRAAPTSNILFFLVLALARAHRQPVASAVAACRARSARIVREQSIEVGAQLTPGHERQRPAVRARRRTSAEQQ